MPIRSASRARGTGPVRVLLHDGRETMFTNPNSEASGRLALALAPAAPAEQRRGQREACGGGENQSSVLAPRPGGEAVEQLAVRAPPGAGRLVETVLGERLGGA